MLMAKSRVAAWPCPADGGRGRGGPTVKASLSSCAVSHWLARGPGRGPQRLGLVTAPCSWWALFLWEPEQPIVAGGQTVLSWVKSQAALKEFLVPQLRFPVPKTSGHLSPPRVGVGVIGSRRACQNDIVRQVWSPGG